MGFVYNGINLERTVVRPDVASCIEVGTTGNVRGAGISDTHFYATAQVQAGAPLSKCVLVQYDTYRADHILGQIFFEITG
jgi:hypothetical protein